MDNPRIQVEGLVHTFHSEAEARTILQEPSWQLARGQQMALIGRSGSGKTTLLNILAGLEKPTAGKVYIDGIDLYGMPESERLKLRAKAFGFVFQSHHLLPEFSALENVCMPLWIQGYSEARAIEKANALLSAVGLFEQRHQRPRTLSGGEQQRVAIARAFVGEPSCVFADEPTGNLDSHTAEIVVTLMCQLAQARKMNLIVVTHDSHLAEKLGLVHTLEEGRLVPH